MHNDTDKVYLYQYIKLSSCLSLSPLVTPNFDSTHVTYKSHVTTARALHRPPDFVDVDEGGSRPCLGLQHAAGLELQHATSMEHLRRRAPADLLQLHMLGWQPRWAGCVAQKEARPCCIGQHETTFSSLDMRTT